MNNRIARTSLAAAELVAISWLGGGILWALFGFAIAGVALLPALGFGLLLLAAAALLCYGISWFETTRSSWLLGVAIPTPSFRKSPRGDWLRVPHTLWLQIANARNGRAILHLVIATVLGSLVVWLIRLIGSAVGLVAAAIRGTESIPLRALGDWLPVQLAPAGAAALGIVGVIVSLAVIAGLAVAHLAISRALLVPSREAELRDAAASAQAGRIGAVHAADVERTRIERDLHDGIQPRLVSIGMTLGLAKQRVFDDPASASELIDEAHGSTKAAITELRQLARGIHSSVLEDRGLDAALSALAARSHTPVQLDVRLDARCGRAAETAVYFTIAEAITNAQKHARASNIRVAVRRREPDTLWARIEDDGIGGARVTPGGGLDGIASRIAAVGGTWQLDSPAGGPTALEVSIPCAS